MGQTIEGERICLVPITDSDTEYIVKWRNNPRVRDNFRFCETFTSEIHQTWMENSVKTGKAIQYVIRIKENEKPIGSVYFRDIDNDRKIAEFGIFIGEDSACGFGYGDEATGLLTEYGIKELGFEEIKLRVFADNMPAILCYKKAGYSEIDDDGEDIVRGDGQTRHMIHMVLRADR